MELLVADELALKQITLMKGASGVKPCHICANVVVDRGSGGAYVSLQSIDISKMENTRLKVLIQF